MLDGEAFICLGHLSDNKTGLGKLNKHGYHGNEDLYHKFYYGEKREETIEMHQDILTLSNYESVRSWPSSIPSLEDLKAIQKDSNHALFNNKGGLVKIGYNLR
jgi:hypothetical protein